MQRPIINDRDAATVRAFGSLALLLSTQRKELSARFEASVRARLPTDGVDRCELLDTLPTFLDELIGDLERVRWSAGPMHTGPVSPVAIAHGVLRFRHGFRVDEVVREYGLLHEAILELADMCGYTVNSYEQRALARAISRATAAAVSEYARRRDLELQREAAEHFSFVAHELRNPLTSARAAYERLARDGSIPRTRAAEVIGRGLTRVGELIDHALAAARLGGRTPLRIERVVLQEVIADAISESATDAESRGIKLITEIQSGVELEADRRLLRSVVTNLLRNGIKFTHDGERVIVRGSAHEGSVVLEIEDSCGGIPAERVDGIFAAGVQAGADRSGFGLGLAIARQAVEAHGGSIAVRNEPGRCCAFVVELPQTARPSEPV